MKIFGLSILKQIIMKKKNNTWLKEGIFSFPSFLKNAIISELNDFDENAAIRIFKIFSCIAFLILIYAFVFSGFQVVDEFEHLHASWLVSIGKVPYRDFFEHHNPLLWYLSAPIVNLFYDNVAIFYIMRGVSFAVSVLSLALIYKISLFFTSRIGAWLASSLFLVNIITIYNFSQFRPDNFMNCCFLLGIYFLFNFLHKKQLKTLIFSFLAFTFSALFLQKISLLLFVVEGILLFLLLSKRISIKHLTLAALPSIFVVSAFFFFLFLNNTLQQYFELNLHFNKAKLAYFDR